MKKSIHAVNYAVSKVIYDNDGVWESSGTADFFYFVLASQGAIDLRGVITTCTTRHREDVEWEWPFPPLADHDLVSERQAFIGKCRRSGLRNIADCIAGPSTPLDSGGIRAGKGGYDIDGRDHNFAIDGWPNVYCNPRDPEWLNVNCGAQRNSHRLMENVDLIYDPAASSGYAVGRTLPGEWIEYTVMISAGGKYDLVVAVRGQEGIFHIEFDGQDVTGEIQVPDTGAENKYRTVTRKNIQLPEGQKVMRVCFDRAGNEFVGVFDHIKIRESAPEL